MAQKLIDIKAELFEAKKRVKEWQHVVDRLKLAESITAKNKQELDKKLFLTVFCVQNNYNLDEIKETQEWYNEYVIDQVMRND